MDHGMQIDESDEHSRNARNPIREGLEPGSNVTFESASQSRKQSSQSISTEDGMQIDESDEQGENAEDPIHESLEHASNVKLYSTVQ
jgi:hypothetical protein